MGSDKQEFKEKHIQINDKKNSHSYYWKRRAYCIFSRIKVCL